MRILIVDDDRMVAKTLQDILRVKDYEVEVAYSGLEALQKLEKFFFKCVLSDIKMPEVSGVELYRAIKARQPELPVVLMTAYTTDKLVQEGIEEGVIACLTKPLDISLLLNFFSLVRKERTIAIIDDDSQFCRTLGDILRVRDFSVVQITNPHDVVERLGANNQVVLLDMKLNHISGLDVLKELRQWHPHLPVILMTGYRQEMSSMIESALNLSAYTCLYKPLQIEGLLQALTEIHRKELGRILGQEVAKVG